MSYIKKISILLGIVLVAVILLIFSSQTDKFLFPEEFKTSQENIQEKTKEELILIIDSGKELPQILILEYEEGMTAFDLLEKKTTELGLFLKTKVYENMGIFVEVIGSEENGKDGKYWMYYVNGQMPPVAADKYEIKPGDKIEFKFEKSPF